MTREELITSKEYIQTGIQLNLLNLIERYMQIKKINRSLLSKELMVSKGYVSQVLNAAYDHKISKMVELALSCNAIPLVFFVDRDQYVKQDAEDKCYDLVPMIRSKKITYHLTEGSNINIDVKHDVRDVYNLKELETSIFFVAPQKTTSVYEKSVANI
jgi:hypothetical protein